MLNMEPIFDSENDAILQLFSYLELGEKSARENGWISADVTEALLYQDIAHSKNK